MGPLVLTVEEADRLVPALSAAFDGFDRLRERSRQVKVKMTALEVIWAEKVSDPACPDHEEYRHHLEAMERLNAEFSAVAGEIEAMGGTVKGVDAGLVDFYAVRDGRLVFLCWQRGERAIAFWHHVDEGFDGRRPLSTRAR